MIDLTVSKFNTIITSGAYVGEEIQAEFGRIPPAFLPIGASFLFRHQLREIENRSHIWISLPKDYCLTSSQERILKDSAVNIIWVDPKKSLGESVFQAILEVGPDLPLEIIHGDTLVLGLEKFEIDTVSISEATAHYSWGVVQSEGDRLLKVQSMDQSELMSADQLILSGYFAFAEPWRFLKCLVANGFIFTGALDQYSSELKVRTTSRLTTLDCGHLKTFYSSRRSLAAARQFNSLVMESEIVRKTSLDNLKIDAEANWLRTIPSELQPFTIRLIENFRDQKSGEYSTLYANYPTVSELYLARTPRVVWTRILESCLEYLDKASVYLSTKVMSPFPWLVIGKLRERISQYPDHLPSDKIPLEINDKKVGTLESIVGYLAKIVEAEKRRPACIMHGDFCFSNMLYDIRSDRIQLIDPRGLIRNEATIYGDIRYDIAKLGHSMVGRYDQILGEKLQSDMAGSAFRLIIPSDEQRDWLSDTFLNSQIGAERFDSPAVKAAIVSIFLSMVPLHSEDPERQRTLFANGLRLFASFFQV